MAKSMMNKGRLRYILLAALFVILHFTGIIQQEEARFTATVYMVIKHRDLHWDYKRIEFAPHFGEYMVTYQDQDGDEFSLSIWPKSFPLIVKYDPLDQP